MSVDWSREPDLQLLNEAYDLLATEPERALVELRNLADRGSVASMLYIATALRDNSAQSNDLGDAAAWYRRAMEAGSALGAYGLGREYFSSGKYPEAYAIFEVGAAKNFAPSLNMLGLMCLNGQGVNKDIDKARSFFERAAALGHFIAMRNVGIVLIRGVDGFPGIFRGIALYARAIARAVVATWNNPPDDRLR